MEYYIRVAEIQGTAQFQSQVTANLFLHILASFYLSSRLCADSLAIWACGYAPMKTKLLFFHETPAMSCLLLRPSFISSHPFHLSQRRIQRFAFVKSLFLQSPKSLR